MNDRLLSSIGRLAAQSEPRRRNVASCVGRAMKYLNLIGSVRLELHSDLPQVPVSWHRDQSVHWGHAKAVGRSGLRSRRRGHVDSQPCHFRQFSCNDPVFWIVDPARHICMARVRIRCRHNVQAFAEDRGCRQTAMPFQPDCRFSNVLCAQGLDIRVAQVHGPINTDVAISYLRHVCSEVWSLQARAHVPTVAQVPRDLLRRCNSRAQSFSP